MPLEIVSGSPLVDKPVCVLHHPERNVPVFKKNNKKIDFVRDLQNQQLNLLFGLHMDSMFLVVPVLTDWHYLLGQRK
jgi:hypothetical protein